MSELKRILGEAIGEGSLCWDPIPVGDFKSTEASAIVDKTVAEIEALPNLWKDACLELVSVLGLGEMHKRPMDFISFDDWKRIKEMMAEAGI